MDSSQHVIVTGGTSGIGEATARGLAAKGATTIIFGRNDAKARRLAEHLRADTGNDDIHVVTADLSSVASTRAAVASYLKRFDRLDVLINNAGGMFSRRQESVDGFEMTLALNHLGPFVLTLGLLDLLKATAAANPEAGARIVNVSSDAHRSGVQWDDLQSQRRYRMFSAYGQSKAMNVLFSNELARRLEGTGVTVNALHPGLVRTSIARNAGMPVMAALFGVIGLFTALPPEQGAQTSLYLATSPEVQGVTGRYFVDSKEKEPVGGEVLDVEAQGRLWELSEGWIRT